MPKVDKIPCPTPGCGEQLPVRTTKTGKPYVSCQECGFDGYARKPKSIRAFFGDEDGAASPSEKKTEKPDGKKTLENEFFGASPKEPSGKKDDWDW